MLDNSRIVHRRYLMAYGTVLISAFFIFTINIELLTSQESTASDNSEGNGGEADDHACIEEASASSVIEAGRIAGRIITVSHPCESTTGPNPDGDTQPRERSETDRGDDTNGDDTNGDGTNGGSTNGGSTNGGSTNGGSTNGGSTNGGSTNGGSTNGGSTNGGSTNGGSTETEPDQEPTVPEEEPNPSDVQSEDSQTIDESTSGATQSGVIHRNTTDGFQIQVPAGWVVEDIDNTNVSTQMSEEQSGYTSLARICPLDNALIVSGGRYQCEQGSTANVNIMRFNDLHQRPEFASLGNRNSSMITTSDFLSYYVQFWQISDVQIWNNTDTTVNVINSQTNQTVATMPAKLVESTYLYSPDGTTMTQGRDFTLLVLNGGIGYSLSYEGLASSLTSGTPPFQVDQVFDSFRLLTAPPGV